MHLNRWKPTLKGMWVSTAVVRAAKGTSAAAEGYVDTMIHVNMAMLTTPPATMVCTRQQKTGHAIAGIQARKVGRAADDAAVFEREAAADRPTCAELGLLHMHSGVQPTLLHAHRLHALLNDVVQLQQLVQQVQAQLYVWMSFLG